MIARYRCVLSHPSVFLHAPPRSTLGCMDVSVVGSNSVTLPAECVVVSLTVGFTGAENETVIRDTAEAVQSVRARMDAAIADDGGSDARLTGLRTWTNIPYDQNGVPGEPQHVAEVRGSVTIKDLSRVAGFLGDLSAMPGVEVGGLNWRLFDATLARVQPEVLRGAFDDAEQRAKWIAEAADQSGLRVERIEDGGAPHFGYGQGKMMSMAMDSASGFDLDPEDVNVSASLNVTFTTGERR